MSASKVYSYPGLQIQNSANAIIIGRASIMKFTGSGVTVAQSAGKTVVTISAGGAVVGTPNTLAFFDNAGNLSENVLLSYFDTTQFAQIGTVNANFHPTKSFIVGSPSGVSVVGVNTTNFYLGNIGVLSNAGLSFDRNFYHSGKDIGAGSDITLTAGSTISGCLISLSGGTGEGISLAQNINLSRSVIIGNNFRISTNQGATTGMKVAYLNVCNPGGVGNISSENLFEGSIIGYANEISLTGATTNTSLINFFGSYNSYIVSADVPTSVSVYGTHCEPNSDDSYLYGHSLGSSSGFVGSVPYFQLGMYGKTIGDRNSYIAEFFAGTSVTPFQAWGIRRNNQSFEAKLINLSVGPQIVGAGDTVLPTKSIIDLSLAAPGAITLSLATAIADGVNDGQIATLRNLAGDSITVPANANTRQAGGTDAVLTQGSTISYSWSQSLTDWLETSRSIV